MLGYRGIRQLLSADRQHGLEAHATLKRFLSRPDGLHRLGDRALRALAGFPERQAELAAVEAGELHRVLDADGVAVEEEGLDQREILVVQLSCCRKIAVHARLSEHLYLGGEQI